METYLFSTVSPSQHLTQPGRDQADTRAQEVQPGLPRGWQRLAEPSLAVPRVHISREVDLELEQNLNPGTLTGSPRIPSSILTAVLSTHHTNRNSSLLFFFKLMTKLL